MIYEKLDLKIDIERLRRHLETAVLPLPPVMQGKTFGGWSVLSSDGSYTDGWLYGPQYWEEVDGKLVFNFDKARAAGWKPERAYRKPTEICTGYLAEVIQKIEDAGLHPRRARISVLKADGKPRRHSDGQADEYAVRLHIPIITNPGCVFACDEGNAHLPADGHGYLLAVNRMHQIFNWGDSDRFHLIMNVWDTRKITRWHQFDGDFEELASADLS